MSSSKRRAGQALHSKGIEWEELDKLTSNTGRFFIDDDARAKWNAIEDNNNKKQKQTQTKKNKSKATQPTDVTLTVLEIKTPAELLAISQTLLPEFDTTTLALEHTQLPTPELVHTYTAIARRHTQPESAHAITLAHLTTMLQDESGPSSLPPRPDDSRMVISDECLAPLLWLTDSLQRMPYTDEFKELEIGTMLQLAINLPRQHAHQVWAQVHEVTCGMKRDVASYLQQMQVHAMPDEEDEDKPDNNNKAKRNKRTHS